MSWVFPERALSSFGGKLLYYIVERSVLELQAYAVLAIRAHRLILYFRQVHFNSTFVDSPFTNR